MKTLLLSGDTYKNRADIARLGFIFSYTENGYIGNFTQLTEALTKKIDSLGLEYKELDFIDIDEEYRASQKKARAEKKAEKYIRYAENAENRSNAAYEKSHNANEGIVFGQPILIGHHSEGKHRRAIEKARNAMDTCCEESEKAKTYENKAEYWKNQTYYTKEEKENKKERSKIITEKALELWRGKHKIGELYEGCHTTNCFTIAKINKTTVTIDTGSKWDIKYARDFPECLQEAKTIVKF